MAEKGFFVKELNVGWEEWTTAKFPTHEGRVARGEFRCECSLGAESPVPPPKASAAPKA